ncbi:AAA domain-containing protein [Flavobacterium sp. J372]|uniref:DEAD/DEAH box helicase n=1 Tax=Flavobacterium sp. J372 TaxID=2898436 RepID=UPI002150B008|nr:AAA domain-containing protein [Flavobacterium sp. J372]MCR5862324.1 AAA domain-containing protein [Flavobacterium sp. J372]
MASPTEQGAIAAVSLYLKIKNGFGSRYDANQENKLRWSDVRSILLKDQITCFFQKYKPDVSANRSRHKIIIPLGNDRSLVAIVSLSKDEKDEFTSVYSYQVSKLYEASFFTEPTKYTVRQGCMFHIIEAGQIGGTDSIAFQKLYREVESGEIPLIDINKEKDRQIWEKYVSALKTLIKRKEQVWKILKINLPYAELREGETERSYYVDITIDEKDLIAQMEKDILSIFGANDLEDYGVSDRKAFVEFKNYRELAPLELKQLKSLAEELFYELNESPNHYLSGRILFQSTNPIQKIEVFRDIELRLREEYLLDIAISDQGQLDIMENDVIHLLKVLEDNYPKAVSLKKDNMIPLAVEFKIPKDIPGLCNAVKEQLSAEGLDRACVTYEQENGIQIAVSSYLRPDRLVAKGLSFHSAITRFAPFKKVKLAEVEGLLLKEGTYQLINAGKMQIDEAAEKLSALYPSNTMRRLPTLYNFRPSQQPTSETLRNFKTAVDVKGQINFSMQNKRLYITADSAEQYNTLVADIETKFPEVLVERKEFQAKYFLAFTIDSPSERGDVIAAIQDRLRKDDGQKIVLDPVKDNTTLLFNCDFRDVAERKLFKQRLAAACKGFEDVVNISFDTKNGRTIWELVKNETLELEKEKLVRRNISQATFIYLTPEQKNSLAEKISKYGDDAIFKEGIIMGKLVRKDKNRLKFKITSLFDNAINGRGGDRIDLDELEKGYIKPIFPGELTNITRMIKAMKKVTEPSFKNGYPVNLNLANFLFDPNEARQAAEDFANVRQKVVESLNEPLLGTQPKQLEAVTKTLTATDMALIQGPPGTGKTTVIAEIIWQSLRQDPGSRLLITSQTNLAVDNALERIKGKKSVRPLRIGNTDKFEDEGKAYSNDRITKWMLAKKGSEEEKINSDNAVSEWLSRIVSRCSDEPRYSKAVTKWKQGLEARSASVKKVFTDAYYKYVNVFAATCSECGSRNFADAYKSAFQQGSENPGEPEFDLVIMDEASKATPPELVLPLTLGKKVVIIGDHKQLPPMIDEKEFGEALEAVGAKRLIEDWTKEDYKISQFEKLFKNSPKSIVTSLDTQFRMHEDIMNCISQFYTDQTELENGLVCGIRAEMDIPDLKVKASRWHGLQLEPFLEPKTHAIWVNVETPEHKVGTSYENPGEAEAIRTVLLALGKAKGYNDYNSSFSKDEDREIGIITYYMPQMQRIRTTLYPTFSRNEWRNFEQHKLDNEFSIPLRINTVDRFQGMERNIVLVSTVRSNRQQIDERGKKIILENNKYPFALGFARELQRINVGFSRAKRLLIIVGNERHFAHKPEYQKAIQKMHKIDIAQLQNLIS